MSLCHCHRASGLVVERVDVLVFVKACRKCYRGQHRFCSQAASTCPALGGNVNVSLLLHVFIATCNIKTQLADRRSRVTTKAASKTVASSASHSVNQYNVFNTACCIFFLPFCTTLTAALSARAIACCLLLLCVCVIVCVCCERVMMQGNT